MKTLDLLGVPYRVAIEPQEYDAYAAHLRDDQLLVLPFSNHGKGSGPARNYVWEHSIDEGHDRHWVLDDNIHYFARFHHNRRNRVESGAFFRAIEDFVDRYENVAMAGPQYRFFAAPQSYYLPVVLNVRLMSCILIQNNIPHRWRGRYNEDVDLSIRVLKDNYSTMMFFNFLQEKAETGTIKGGNTEELYGSGTYDKSKMLAMLHPDCVKMVHRYGRDHHLLDTRHFHHIMPKLKDGIDLSAYPKIDNYGYTYVKKNDDDSVVKIESKPWGCEK